MAVNIQSHLRYRNSSGAASMRFRRSSQKDKTVKIRRKIRLGIRHLFLFFLLIAAIFLGLQRLFFFLLTWENLTVNEVVVQAADPALKQAVENRYSSARLGNLMILDISRIRRSLTSLRTVKDVRVKKIFPSSLKIDIIERTPEALIRKKGIFLIDREGILLEEISDTSSYNLPLLTDSGGFARHFEEKMQFAWKFLEDLTPEQRLRIESLDLSRYGSINIKLIETSSLILLGNDNFSEKIQLYDLNRENLEKFGPLQYVDLRLDDRITILPLNPIPRREESISQKEAS